MEAGCALPVIPVILCIWGTQEEEGFFHSFYLDSCRCGVTSICVCSVCVCTTSVIVLLIVNVP